MMMWGLHFLVVVPLVLIATAAVWFPRPWQWVLLYGGPVVTLLAFCGVPYVDRLGWIILFGLPWAYCIALPLLPWRREWPRIVISVTVLALAAILVAVGRATAPINFYVLFPTLAALTGLAIEAVVRRDRRKLAASPEAAD